MTYLQFRFSGLLAPFLAAFALAASDARCGVAFLLIQAQKIRPFRTFSHLIRPFRTILKHFFSAKSNDRRVTRLAWDEWHRNLSCGA